MNYKTSVVFHGFLQLPNLDKLELVNSINEYFDSTERETLRAAADLEFEKLRSEDEMNCPCCGR